MLTTINPKLPMRDKNITRAFYINKLGFEVIGSENFKDYLMLKKDVVEIHFFQFSDLNPKENYGQVYIRTSSIDEFYVSLLDHKTRIHPNGALQIKPWGQKNFRFLIQTITCSLLEKAFKLFV